MPTLSKVKNPNLGLKMSGYLKRSKGSLKKTIKVKGSDIRRTIISGPGVWSKSEILAIFRIQGQRLINNSQFCSVEMYKGLG